MLWEMGHGIWDGTWDMIFTHHRTAVGGIPRLPAAATPLQEGNNSYLIPFATIYAYPVNPLIGGIGVQTIS
jgi:hypothetical protein